MKNSFHTVTTIRMIKRVSALFVLCLVFLLQSSCVKEDRSDCPYESLLYIVVDTEGWNAVDIVEGATVFFFDSDLGFLSSVYVSGDDIAANVPIPVSYRTSDPPWVVVWGNLGNRESYPVPAAGDKMDNLQVSMSRGTDGYSFDSDKLFYGAKRLSGQNLEYVTITPKTGRIMITVQGLTPSSDPDAYYFTVDTPYDKYNYTGAPLQGDAALRFTGVFDGDELITSQPYHMFHFLDSVRNDDYLTIRLYANVPQGYVVLAEVQYDDDDNPILIHRAKTTHVLIVVDPRGDISVSVSITDWRDSYEQSIGW